MFKKTDCSKLNALGYISLVLALVADAGESLKLSNMSAPAVIDYREDMKLDCAFDMGDEQLYAVKWYKDENEFFRYMPHQDPHKLHFPVFGVHIQSTSCTESRCHIVLSNLKKVKSSGAYRCEVSSEAPSFRLASRTQNVTVAAVPKDNPSIEGLEDSYFEGDILTAKCVSSPSDPPQLITWYINREQASSKFVRDMKMSKPDHDGLVSTSQLLRFVVERKHIEGGRKRVEVTCVAAFAGSPASARQVTVTAPIYDHDAQMSNPRYTYWHTSSASKIASSTTFLIALVAFTPILQLKR